MSWGYTTTNGPATWPQLFPQAAGERQSPVDIITSQTQQGSDLKAKPLKWKYVQENAKSLVNPGYCWRVDINGRGSELTGGPLGDDIYVIEQFHCHWGCNDQEGSEHTVDGKAYAGELHLVHWNSTKYASFQEAAGKSDGLAVLGVFVNVGKHHGELEKVSKLLPFVQHKGDRVTFIDSLDPAKLLPSTYGYWTYLGSLTTPPCTESVTWIVFKEAIELSEQQLNHFRELRCYDVNEECPCDELKGKVIQNYRPPLPLGNRELREYGGH
jgi:carbonic anhydrase